MSALTSRGVVERLLEPTGIRIGSAQPFDITVHDNRFYERLLKGGSLAFGESYVDGWWDSEQLDELVRRVFVHGVHDSFPDDPRVWLHLLRSRVFNLQSIRRAFQVGRHHYDIGNDLYRRMLGETLSYTCAYWRHADRLDQAQRAKFDLVCRKLGLREGMHILELGCGWATFARYAAATHGVRVTAYTVSKEQARLGRELCAGLPVDIRLEDYRFADGEHDAVVSIGIMEHIGYKNYRTYMDTAHRCLKPGGVAFVHTIGGNLSRTHIEPWMGSYIFPNAMLPSISQLGEAMEGRFILEDVHNIGPDYDPTLMAWWRNFDAAWPELAPRYGERFRRMWRYYLLGCAGCFRARHTQLWQLVMTRSCDGRPPPCRVV